ncbi:MAG: restriction endonuclease subunit S [Fibrobacter sp.]|nr:restriction endonuclease subunit S [Fibrobacter sp.]
MEMAKTELRNVLNFFNGKQRPNTVGNYPVYGGNGIIDYVSEYNYEDNIIIGRVGANCGSIQKCEGKCWVSDNAISVTVKDGFCKNFIYHMLKALDLNKKHVGAAQPLITQEIIAKQVVVLPSFENQKKIAAVLSALDDKIALNKKMNQKLEAMAKRLYDYWFVQFDFPDENGRPYKTSGGPMVYNETLNREIPEGWEVAGFSDFGTFKNGINYDKEEIGDQTVKIVNVRNISESTTYFNIEDLDDITLKTECLEKFITTSNDILLARSGSPGATRLLPKTEKKVIYCGFIIRYQLNENDLEKQLYLFHVLKNYEQITAVQSAGSILKNISQDTLNALTVLNPNLEVLRAFNEKISPIYALLRKNLNELNKLTALRDKLLPLLMNGQVMVG